MATAGAQKVLMTKARWFHDHGYRVSAAFFYDKQHLESRWRGEYPFQIFSLQAWNAAGNWFGNSLRLIAGLFRLFIFMKKSRFDVVETYTLHSNLLGLLVAWLVGIPVRIGSHHGKIEDIHKWLQKIHGFLINSRITSLLVAVSNRVKKYAMEQEGALEEKIIVIENGIDLPAVKDHPNDIRANIRREFKVDEKAKLIVSVGRLTVQKGHEYLLDSIPMVLEKFPSAIFLIAGEGYLLESLLKKTRKLGISKSVHFLGIREDVPDLLIASDAFAMPSLWEGMPIAMLEAMAYGTPVIASHVEGVEDVIEHELNGLTIPPKDVDALATGILRLLENPAEAARFGAAAKKMISSRYSADYMCSKYEELFLKYLNQAGH